MTSRRGVGKLRHMDFKLLWTLDAAQEVGLEGLEGLHERVARLLLRRVPLLVRVAPLDRLGDVGRAAARDLEKDDRVTARC